MGVAGSPGKAQQGKITVVEKKWAGSLEQKRALIDPGHAQVSIVRQCDRLDLARSSYYYQGARESEENLQLMRLLDEQYTRTPFYGIGRMTAWLHTQGSVVNHKRVARLMRVMGIEAIYPKPHLSRPGEQLQRYPYLLRNVSIQRVNQVWCTDITSIRLRRGFLYLVAILDWFSRSVLAWQTSITLDASFCLEALEQALRRGHPEIVNSDQGVQFTSRDFTGRLQAADIQRGRF
jgi:putative transposase